MTEEHYEQMAVVILPEPVIELANLEHRPLHYGPRRRPILPAAAARPAGKKLFKNSSIYPLVQPPPPPVQSVRNNN